MILGRQKLRIVNHKQQVCNSFNNACQTKQKGEFVTKEFKITLNKKCDEWIVLQPDEVDTQKALWCQYL